MLKDYYNNNYSTDELFILDQLYDKMSKIEIHKNKSNFKQPNKKKTITQDIESIYINKGIKLLNKLPYNIKVIESNS